MLTAIIDLIIKLLNFIISFILGLIIQLFPNFGLSQLASGIDTFFDMIGNAFNLVYFIFGPSAFIISDIIILLWTAKHIVLPVVNFVRKFASDIF